MPGPYSDVQVKSALSLLEEMARDNPDLSHRYDSIASNAKGAGYAALLTEYGSEQEGYSNHNASQWAYRSQQAVDAFRKSAHAYFKMLRGGVGLVANSDTIREKLLKYAIELKIAEAQEAGFHAAQMAFMTGMKKRVITFLSNPRVIERLVQVETALKTFTGTLKVAAGLFAGLDLVEALDAATARAMIKQADDLLDAGIIDARMHKTLTGIAVKLADKQLYSATTALGLTLASPESVVLSLGTSIASQTSYSWDIKALRSQFDDTITNLRSMAATIEKQISEMKEQGNPDARLFRMNGRGELEALLGATYKQQLDTARTARNTAASMFENPPRDVLNFYATKANNARAKLSGTEDGYEYFDDVLVQTNLKHDAESQTEIAQVAIRINQERERERNDARNLKQKIEEFKKSIDHFENTGKRALDKLEGKENGPLISSLPDHSRYNFVAVDPSERVAPIHIAQHMGSRHGAVMHAA